MTLGDLTDCSLPGSSVRGISKARILEWVVISYSRDCPDRGIEPRSPVLAGGFFTTVPSGNPADGGFLQRAADKPVIFFFFFFFVKCEIDLI